MDILVWLYGGTYSVHPTADAQWIYLHTSAYDSNGKPTNYSARQPQIPAGYEVKGITTTQNGETTTLYRVRQEISSSTALNDKGGNNETEDIKVTEDVTIANDATTAKYVEVADGTVTIPEGKSLEVTNGLDVSGDAKVVVEPGSTLAVREGGVISSTPDNIVIEADENGSASFLLSPDVIVNTTPNLTVKMTAKQIGSAPNVAGGVDYYWHRFAMPVEHITSLPRTPNKLTYIKYWDYSIGAEGNWADVTSLEELEPFVGYCMTLSEARQDVEYTFQGNLSGNQNSTLDFTKKGFNFFGNSYTGYISLDKLVDQITAMGDDKIEGSVWVWAPGQTYDGVGLQELREHPEHFIGEEYKTEIAPMQTFILLQKSAENISTEINYANAIWGNPRYSSITGTPAPVRRSVEAGNDTYMRVVITAADGKSDAVRFLESENYSDAFDNGYDVSKYMNNGTINVYSTVEGTNYGTVATDQLEGKTISVETNDALTYTLSFKNVTGEPYAIKDEVTGKVIAIEEGQTYEFAAQPNSTVEGRFRIVAVNEVVTSVEATEMKSDVKGIYTILGQYVGKDFNSLPAGIYVVGGVKIVK